MTLKTSSHKINNFKNMTLFTIRKSIGIAVILSIAILLYCPGSFIANSENMKYTANSISNTYNLEVFAEFIAAAAGITVTVLNIVNLGFIYKRNASDLYFSFPLTRTQLIFSKITASFITTAIPLFLGYTAYGIMICFNSWMGSFVQLLYFLLNTLVVMLVCSSFSLIFIVSAGSMFDMTLSLVGVNVALLIIGSIYENILNVTLLGYSSNSTQTAVMYTLSPYYLCVSGFADACGFVKHGISEQSIDFFIRSIIYTALFTAVAVLLFKYRKSEKGESAYAYKFMYFLCSMLAGICGGYFVGILFCANIKSVWFWIFMTAGSLIVAAIFGLITNRGLKGIGISLLTGAAAAIMTVLVSVIGITGAFGYEKRIPKTDEIKSSSVYIFGEGIEFETDNSSVITDLHRAIIGRNAATDDSASGIATKRIHIEYSLKNGDIFSRTYQADTSKIKDELQKIYKSEDRIRQIKEKLPIDSALELMLEFYNDGKHYSVPVTKNEINEFLDAYFIDLKNSTAYLFDTDEVPFEISGNTEKDGEEYFSIMLERDGSFTNSGRFITEHNLKERAKDFEETEKVYG